MPAAVYSEAFVAQAGLDGTVSVTVPLGRVWILRDLDVVSLFDGAGYAILLGGAAQRIWQVSVPAGGTAGWHYWSGRQVVASEQSVSIQTGGGIWDVSLSGYNLAA